MTTFEVTRSHNLVEVVAGGLIALEVILALVTIGITGSSSAGFRKNLQCDVPSKLNYNLAIAIVTFLALPILCFTDWYMGVYRQRWARLSWKVWAGIFGCLIILWAAAIGSSIYTCSNLCSACDQPYPVAITYAGRCCNCAGAFGSAEDICDSQSVLVYGFERVHHWYQATQGLDVVLFLLFIFSLVVVVGQYFMTKPSTSHADLVNLETGSSDLREPPAYDMHHLPQNSLSEIPTVLQVPKSVVVARNK